MFAAPTLEWASPSRGQMVLEAKIWAVNGFIAPGASLLLACPSGQNKTTHVRVLTHEYARLFLFLYLFIF